MTICIARHALRYMVVYPSMFLVCAIKAETKVEGSFSINVEFDYVLVRLDCTKQIYPYGFDVNKI